MVEVVEFLSYCLIQFRQGIEGSVPQSGNDCRGDLTDRAFYGGFLLGLPNTCRHDGSHVMEPQCFVILCQDDISILGMLYHAGFQVVANRPGRNAAEVFIHVDMGAQERIHFHIRTGFHVRILTVWKRCYEQINRNDLSCFPDDI